MEREEAPKSFEDDSSMINKKTVILGIIPFVVIGLMVLFLMTSSNLLLQNSIKPLPQISIEKVEFGNSQIIAFIRNIGPSQVTIAQADVNDRIHPAAIDPGKTLARFGGARVIIPFNWNPGEPYVIGITIDDGARFSRSVKAAAPAPYPTTEQALTFALIGTYVGIIPVMVGLLWYPFIRRLSQNLYNFFLSITAGLLVFLGIDALLEGNKIALDSIAPVFNAQILIIIVTILSLLSLLYASQYLVQRASKSSSSTVNNNKKYREQLEFQIEKKTEDNLPSMTISSSVAANQQRLILKPLAISLMIAIGIGLHNFGEGLAIGASTLLGEIALSSFLIVGFMIHNTTEGLAIVAPIAKSKRTAVGKLLFMGFVAGAPTILGTWIGGFLYSPILTVIFLSVGAGAIFQVIYQLGSWMYRSNMNRSISSNIWIIAGVAIGMLIMYITGFLI